MLLIYRDKKSTKKSAGREGGRGGAGKLNAVSNKSAKHTLMRVAKVNESTAN